MALTTNVFPFPARRVARCSDAIIADLLMQMEDAPWAEPDMRVWLDMSGAVHVHVSLAGRDTLLTPAEAQLTAAAIMADQPWTGAAGVSVRLAALSAEAARAACQGVA